MNVSQSNSGGQTTNASVLKCSDKTSLSFAGLVTTPTGKHILLTSNPNIPPNISGQSTGQKVTFLSKQPISSANAGHQITKAYVKFQLTSVPGGAVPSTAGVSWFCSFRASFTVAKPRLNFNLLLIQ